MPEMRKKSKLNACMHGHIRFRYTAPDTVIQTGSSCFLSHSLPSAHRF
jgi:hypothetical protein